MAGMNKFNKVYFISVCLIRLVYFSFSVINTVYHCIIHTRFSKMSKSET
jgi:hypothetical protein